MDRLCACVAPGHGCKGGQAKNAAGQMNAQKRFVAGGIEQGGLSFALKQKKDMLGRLTLTVDQLVSLIRELDTASTKLVNLSGPQGGRQIPDDPDTQLTHATVLCSAPRQSIW